LVTPNLLARLAEVTVTFTLAIRGPCPRIDLTLSLHVNCLALFPVWSQHGLRSSRQSAASCEVLTIRGNHLEMLTFDLCSASEASGPAN
jgi:hypothetical protein